MIQERSRLAVVDNTQAIEARCVKVYGGGYRSGVGATVLVSLRRFMEETTEEPEVELMLSAGDLRKGILVRSKKGARTLDGG